MADEESLINQNELLLDLGKQLALNSERGLLPKSDNELMNDARLWFENKLISFRSALCGSTGLREAAENEDLATLASAVADLIAGILIGVTPITVAYLLIHYGLDQLCSEEWAKPVSSQDDNHHEL